MSEKSPQSEPKKPHGGIVPIAPGQVPSKPEEAKPEDLYPPEWGVQTPERQQLLKAAIRNRSTRHGIYSSVPMICRDDRCPYKSFCVFQQQGLVHEGERCILEIGKIQEASERYYREFGVDPNDPGARVDVAQIHQLITMEIMIDRCTMLLAIGDLVEEVEVAISESGDVITQPQLHKAADALPKFQRRHSEILRDLNATRKEKASTQTVGALTIDQFTKQLLASAADAQDRHRRMLSGERIELDELESADDSLPPALGGDSD